MASKPTTIDEYLAQIRHADTRAALQRLRVLIKAAAPEAEEGIIVLFAEQFDGRGSPG